MQRRRKGLKEIAQKGSLSARGIKHTQDTIYNESCILLLLLYK